MNISNILTTSAQKVPGKPAIVCDNESISYGELDRSTTLLTRWFLRQGRKTGDRIAIYWPNSIETVKLFFASFKAGMIAVPINVRMKTPEVAYILEDSQAKMLFAHPDLLSVAQEARSASRQFTQIQTTLAYEEDLGPLPVMNDYDPALLLYTSGTTERPKGVTVTQTHRTLSECVKLTHAIVPDLESALVMTQMAFISAMCIVLLPAMAKGGTGVLVPAFDAPSVLDLIERFQITYAFGLPSMVQAMIEEQARKPRQVHSLRNFVGAGDSVPVSTQ